jgi:hypothetical protein
MTVILTNRQVKRIIDRCATKVREIESNGRESVEILKEDLATLKEYFDFAAFIDPESKDALWQKQ